MKNKLKNIFTIFILIFVFSAISLIGVNFSYEKDESVTKAATGPDVTIKTSADLVSFINAYDSVRAGYDVVLDSDIDMTGVTLHSCIGTEALPFTGTFDGQGHTIKNLTFDMSTNNQGNEVSYVNNYVGLFGNVDGATIKNVGLAGDVSIKIGSGTDAYVGALAGCVKNSDVSYIQNTAKVTFNDDLFERNVNFGGIVGYASSTNFSYIISRAQSFGTWELDNNEDKIIYVGGAFGFLSASNVLFAVESSTFNIEIKSDFIGKVNVGGLVGVVEQKATSIYNAVLDNSFTVQNNSTSVVFVGQVAGKVSSAPNRNKMSYIYYKTGNAGSTYLVFGDEGSYEYDYIASITSTPTTEEAYNSKAWFYQNDHWDFSTDWYIQNQTIYLQAFYGNFEVSLGTELTNGNVLELYQTSETSNYLYGQSAKIVFQFKKDDTNEIDLADYYTLSSLTLDGVEVVKITTGIDGEYQFADTEKYLLEKSGDRYTVTIKHMDLSTATNSSRDGYDIKVTAKKFTISITSRLYDEDVLVEGKIPSTVKLEEGTKKDELTTDLTYDSSVINILTELKPNSPYAFVGWYLVGEERDTFMTANQKLAIKFGQGFFLDNVSIYAKYQDDACEVTFKIDAGVKEITFTGSAGSTTTITETNKKVAVLKTLATAKLEVYIDEKYDFNVGDFIAMLDTYKSTGADQTFCTWLNAEDVDRPANYYLFNLDMTALPDDFTEQGFSINIQTSEAKNAGSKMIWIIAGSAAGGAVLIVVLIVVIILLKRRGGGFGGYSGKSSFKKSSFKDSYY